MQPRTSSSNYASCYAGGLGTGYSDLDMSYKVDLLKTQAFNVFALSTRYFMSPAHNIYLQLQQQQLQQSHTRPKTLTGFGPAGYEQQFLKDNLVDASVGSCKSLVLAGKHTSLNSMAKLNFYSAPYILAPSTIASSTVALTAANLFFKNAEASSMPTNQAVSTAATPTAAKTSTAVQAQQNNGNT